MLGTARWLAWVGLVGCGGADAFTNLFPDNEPVHVAALLERIGPSRAASTPDNALGRPVMAVSRSGDRAGVALVDLSTGETRWTRDLPVDSPPFVGGGAVVVLSEGALVALALDDGEVRGRRDLDGLTLNGVAFGGGRVAAAAARGSGQVVASYRSSRVFVMDEDLSNLLSPLDVEKLVGAPALAGSVLLLPWDRQSVSALDLATGNEICRLVLRDEMPAFLFAAPEGVFYGRRGIFRLTARSASGTRAGGTYVPIEWTDPTFPGEPQLHPDAFDGVGDGRASARARVRLAWYPAPDASDGAVALADDRLYFVYYRYLVAMRPADRALQWVHALPTPAAEVAAVPGGVWVVQESGQVRFLRAEDGASPVEFDLGFGVARAAFSAAGWAPDGEATGGRLRRQVMDALLDVDNQAVPVRSLLLTLFGRSEEPDVSRDLLHLLRDSALPDDIRMAAAQALRLRRDGSEHLSQALADHFDALRGIPAPPVGVIAGALMNMNERSAAPALAEHLADPNTPLADLEELVRAIVALGDASNVPSLQRFLRMYHADSELATSFPVLEAAAHGVLAHGGAAGERFVADLADDRFTASALAQLLRDLMQSRRADEPVASRLPATVSRADVTAVIEGARARLQPCFDEAAVRRPGLGMVDLGITVSGHGVLVDVTVAPSDSALVECLRPLLGALPWPRFQNQQDRFVVPVTAR
jgi:outer membrane protein assembly factor BamB